MADTLIETVLDGDYASLKDNIEQVIAKRLHNRIQEKKVDILAKMNGIPKNQMRDLMGKKA